MHFLVKVRSFLQQKTKTTVFLFLLKTTVFFYLKTTVFFTKKDGLFLHSPYVISFLLKLRSFLQQKGRSFLLKNHGNFYVKTTVTFM